MAMQLNEAALTHARGLLRRGEFTDDERDDWSEHAPTTDQENDFIEKNGLAEFAKWHLGEDTNMGEDTKGRYHFPYGDFRTLHRCAVISGESRAGQYKHDAIEKSLKDLLDGIDRKAGRDEGPFPHVGVKGLAPCTVPRARCIDQRKESMMSDAKDPREEQQLTDVPLEETREDDAGFEPITPDGVDEGTPAVADPKDSQNPPPRRF